MAKYIQIYSDLLAEINSRKLKFGDKLPTEQQLMHSYQVSRITAQKALNNLQEAGFIKRHVGKGSFVIHKTDMDELDEDDFSLPYVSLIMANELQTLSYLKGIERVLSSNKIHTTITITANDSNIELSAIKQAVANKAKGIIYFPSEPFINKDIFNTLLSDNFPVVFLDRSPLDIPCNCITTSGYIGGYLATKHLLDNGHRKVAILNSGLNLFETVNQRYAGYCQALNEYHIPINPDYVLECYQLSEFGYDLLTSSNRPTALFCTNDSVALVIYKLAYSLGLSIPNDISIVGFDNLPSSTDLIPPLTTIEQPFVKMGIEAAEIIISQSKSSSLIKKYLPVKLLERASVKSLL